MQGATVDFKNTIINHDLEPRLATDQGQNRERLRRCGEWDREVRFAAPGTPATLKETIPAEFLTG